MPRTKISAANLIWAFCHSEDKKDRVSTVDAGCANPRNC